MALRRIFAEIKIDENVKEKTVVIKNCENMGLLDYLGHEFGWLENSGITLERAIVSDEDDTEMYTRYIGYLIDWAMTNSAEYIGSCPMSYNEWLSFNNLVNLSYRYTAVDIAELAEEIFAAIKNSTEKDQDGDTCISYRKIASNEFDEVKIAVSEVAENESDGFFSAHVLHSDLGIYCEMYFSDDSSKEALIRMLLEIAENLNREVPLRKSKSFCKR